MLGNSFSTGEEKEFDFAACLVAVRERDEVMSRRLVEQLYPLVIKIVRAHRLRGVAEEDLAQEIFIKMFARLAQYRAEKPFPHWVSRIAVTTCLDRLRFRQRRPEMCWSDLSEAQAALLQDRMDAPENSQAQSPLETREIVNRLLAELEPRDRLILTWLDMEALSVAEIRAKTGWGISLIKVRAMRARLRLRKRLRQLDQERKNDESL